MATSTAQKLRIKEGYGLRTLHAPPDFKKSLGPLPAGVSIGPSVKKYEQLHWFVRNRAQLEEEVSEVLSMVKEDMLCWIYYPKGSSGLQTDLSRDKGWDALLKNKQMQWISLISFDETWSTFGMRLKTEADKKKEAAPKKERAIFQYIDPQTKAVYLPDDLTAALKKDKAASQFFQALSFSNKKEYIEWVVTAKREETRATRVQESIERMNRGWKNPANR